MKAETGPEVSHKRFFHGTVNDGVKKLLFIGFNGSQQMKLSETHAKKEPVTLSNCTLAKATEVELKIRHYTDIAKSSKSFEVTDWTAAIGPSQGSR